MVSRNIFHVIKFINTMYTLDRKSRTEIYSHTSFLAKFRESEGFTTLEITK